MREGEALGIRVEPKIQMSSLIDVEIDIMTLRHVCPDGAGPVP